MTITFAEFIAGFSLPVILLLIGGVALLVIEMFVPGFGAPGILGIISLVLAIILRADSLGAALWMVLIVIAVVGVMLLVFLRYAAKGSFSRSPIVLNDSLDREEGYLSTEDLEYYVGHEGEALTVLRPSGMADFDGVKLDVVSDGEYIQQHARVRVVRVEGRRILVRPVTGNTQPASDIQV